MDPLAAYLVGWTNTLSPEAEEFLDYISKYTKAEWDAARNAESYSGYGKKSTSEYVYEGDLLTGMMHGYGTIIWASGDQYTGDYIDGKRTGTGTYFWANGNRYEGDFLDGQMHGWGVLYYANGSVRSGRWDTGNYLGQW